MKKMRKILGVVLTLAMLAGLFMMAVPVSAANSWAVYGQPKVTAGTAANVYTIAADGMTIYLWDGIQGVTGGKLQKSTDGGYTWLDTGLDTSNKLDNVTQIVVSQFDATELVATDGTTLWRSTNSGQTWADYTPAGAAAITSIDISEGASNGVAYLVGTTAGVWIYDADAVGNWFDIAGGAVLAVKFSPNYPNDTAIVAVTATTVQTYLTNGDPTEPANGWGLDVQDAPLPATATRASIAMPSNYDPNSTSYNRVWVGTEDGVYRFNGKLNTASTITLLDDTRVVSSLAYKGTASAGTLAVGQADATEIITSTAVQTGDTPDWVSSSDTLSDPTGDGTAPNTLVIFSPAEEKLFAGTAGANNALSISTDYTSFAQIAFINVSALANVSLSKLKMAGDNWFIFLNDAGGPSYRLFASPDAGATWKQIRNNGAVQMDSVNFGNYAADKTIYIIQVGATDGKKLLKSSDGGATWSKITSPGNVEVKSMAVNPDGSYWVGSITDGVRLNTSSAKVAIDGENPGPMIPIPGFYLIATTNGSMWMSTDEGASFDRLGDAGQFDNVVPGPAGPPPNFAISPPTKTVYAVEKSTQNILKWVVGTSTAWEIEVSNGDLPAVLQGAPSPGPIGNLGNTAGIWYVISNGNVNGQIWRSFDDQDPNDAGFIDVPGTTGIGFINPGPMSMVPGADGSITYYPIVTRTTAPADEYAVTIYKYVDSLIVAPVATAPAADSVQNNTQVTALGTNTLVDLAWKGVTNAKQYEWQVAYDADFKSIVPFANMHTTALGVSQLSLVPGKTYYWRVRVSDPTYSRWSAGIKFTTAGTSSTSQGLDQEGRIYPLQGAVITGATITFTWGSVPTAETYDIMITKNGTQVDSKTGLTMTTYTYTGLEPGAQYTWAVRAVSGGQASNWVTSAFTTSVPPAPTLAPTLAPVVTPTINIPPQPTPTYTITVPPGTPVAPSTPGYVWVIIVIGAILVIAVIVLIVRTRRV